MRTEFEAIGFRDKARAEQSLDRLIEGRGPKLAQHLAAALREAGDADTALVRLDRYLEAALHPAMHVDLLEAAPRYAQLLVTILDQSHYLTDIVCRNPEYVLWLWEEAELDQARPRDAVAAELLAQTRAFDSFEARCKSLRRYKRRETLRIAARDVFTHAPLVSITEDLSNLADAALEAALDGAREDMVRRYGAPEARDGGRVTEATFCILAMGKLGGRELNFSSDIDLVFIYSRDGQTTGGTSGTLTNVEFFHKLGERIIKAIAEATDEGHVFRVDMRLRPHGRTGPLAVRFDRAVDYYEQHGRAWERQALIKVRPAAGDLELGRSFIEQTRPFVFPRYFDDDTLDDIREVKQQMEAQIGDRGETESDVKLGRGGIRDIEFTVQVLQLLNGGRLEDVRAPNTLEALNALRARGLLRPLDAATLLSNYTFLRQVEHRLQIEGSQQRHTLPRRPDELELFARRLGYPSGPSFLADHRDRTRETRYILDRFLATEGAGHRWVVELLDPNAEAPSGLPRLSALGFRDPAKARQELLVLSVGPAEHPHRAHVRHQFAAIVPVLLEALSSCASPDATLLRLGQILAQLQAPGAIYDVLKGDPSLCRYLVALVDNSEFLAQILIRDPGLFETFGWRVEAGKPANADSDRMSTRNELERRLGELSRAYDRDAALYRFRDEETLRIGMRDLFAHATVTEIGRELSQVADVCLAHALRDARVRAAERFGPGDAPFAVLGLGKLGGCELGYGSDLDLVFVYDAKAQAPSDVAPSEYFAAIVAQTIRTLKEPTRYGILYDVDARLRPDGKKGMLTVSTTRLREYYSDEAQPWERLALVKARAVAGDEPFAHDVEQEARAITFAEPLTDAEVQSIEEVRAKIETQANPLDLKRDRGGLVEIEFAVRILQLRHGHAVPELQRGDVLGAVQVLRESALLDPQDCDALASAYALFRRLENRLRIAQARSISSLPQSAEARTELARRLGLEGDLAELVREHKARVHAVYGRVLGMRSAWNSA